MRSGQPKKIRRGLFGQSLVDFSTASWSSIQLKDSSFCPASQQKRVQPKKTPRLLRSFAQSRVVAEKERGDQPLIPGMSGYSDDINVDAGIFEISNKKKLPQDADMESVASETEESIFPQVIFLLLGGLFFYFIYVFGFLFNLGSNKNKTHSC